MALFEIFNNPVQCEQCTHVDHCERLLYAFPVCSTLEAYDEILRNEKNDIEPYPYLISPLNIKNQFQGFEETES